MTIKKLVDEIEKRTGLYYEKEDLEGNLVPDRLVSLQGLINELKKTEVQSRLAVKVLNRKIRQEVITGNVISLPCTLEGKTIYGDLYLTGKNQIVTHCVFKGSRK